MKVGDRITITPSEGLIEMHLMALAFRHGFVVEICHNQIGIYGAWVELEGGPYLGEIEWFIPVTSMLNENN